MATAKPFTPESLADRWECTAKHIRDLCHKGALSYFKLGKLYRIPANVVDDYERGPSCELDEGKTDAGTGSRQMVGKPSKLGTGTRRYVKQPTSSHGLKVIP